MAEDFDMEILNEMEKMAINQLSGADTAIENAKRVNQLVELVVDLRKRVSILENHMLKDKK